MQSGSASEYPGVLATPAQVLALAKEYRNAAGLLLAACRRGASVSQAPYRLVAVHAIELYLNAALLEGGHPPCAIRRLQHDLAARAELAVARGLRLRVRTISHLVVLASDREYLLARYSPERRAPPPLNQLAATLQDVACKVTAALGESRPTPIGPTRAKATADATGSTFAR